MDQNEVVLRAIGILTESQNMFAALNKGTDAEYEVPAALAGLINDVLPSVPIPADATAIKAAELVGHAAGEAVLKLANAFAFLFSELADVHDAGRSDITSADLLRALALNFSGSPESEG